jgi:hypothetical protein
MIRINHSGSMPFFQNDTSYNLPSVTGSVQWNGMSKKFQVNNGTGWIDIENSINLSTIKFYNDGVFKLNSIIKNTCFLDKNSSVRKNYLADRPEKHETQQHNFPNEKIVPLRKSHSSTGILSMMVQVFTYGA